MLFDDKAATLALYPNPVSKELTVVLPVASGVVTVLDADGKVLLRQEVNNQVAKGSTLVSLEGLNPGFYWVQVLGDGQLFTGKVFKSE